MNSRAQALSVWETGGSEDGQWGKSSESKEQFYIRREMERQELQDLAGNIYSFNFFLSLLWWKDMKWPDLDYKKESALSR